MINIDFFFFHRNNVYKLNHLNSLLQAIGQLDYKNDAYLKRILNDIFKNHFETITWDPSKKNVYIYLIYLFYNFLNFKFE